MATLDSSLDWKDGHSATIAQTGRMAGRSVEGADNCPGMETLTDLWSNNGPATAMNNSHDCFVPSPGYPAVRAHENMSKQYV